MMKKLVSLVLALVFTVAFSCSAFAADFTFDEFGISYSLPENWFAVTADTPESDPVFANYLYYDETMAYMADLGLSLYAVTADFNTEFSIELSKSEDYVELSDYSKLQLKQACNQVKTTWESYGFENCVVDTYSNDLTTFITVNYDYLYGDSRVYGLDYVAYIDGNYTVLCLYSYDGAITEVEAETMKSVVDSIVSTNEVPSDSGSGSSSSSRGLSRLIRRVIILACAGISSFFAWIKKKKSKNTTVPSEAPFIPEANAEPAPDAEESFESFAEEPPSIDETEENRCSSCGAPLSESDKFCPVCGSKVK